MSWSLWISTAGSLEMPVWMGYRGKWEQRDRLAANYLGCSDLKSGEVVTYQLWRAN